MQPEPFLSLQSAILPFQIQRSGSNGAGPNPFLVFKVYPALAVFRHYY
jgi:hypothetical protein